jgi:hypothetical protein
MVFVQGRREGVKGVTVSRGPGMKRGPKIKEKLGKIKNSFILGPKFLVFQGPETLRP